MEKHDRKRALREELAGLSDVLGALRSEERRAEEDMSRAEERLNAVRKIIGFARIVAEDKRAELDRIEKEEQES